MSKYEPRREKTGLRSFRPGLTQAGLYSHRKELESSNFGYKKRRHCTILVAKTETLISFVVTAMLICAFVFSQAKSSFLLTRHLLSHTKTNNLQMRKQRRRSATAKLISVFLFATRIVQFFFFLNLNSKSRAIFCACTARFVSIIFGNNSVGFLMTRFKFCL